MSAVGVIVPTRNAAAHVEAALRSVLAAVPPGVDLDLLVVDGASTDDTVALSSSLPGVRVIAQRGGGLAAARNQGLASVNGEMIGFCDADDQWSQDSLQLRLGHLEQNPACDAVIGLVAMIALAGEEVPSGQQSRLGATFPGFTPGALLARRATFAAVGAFTEGLRVGADSEWFVRLTESGLRCDRLPDLVLSKGARMSSLSTDVQMYRTELLGVARGWLERRRSDGRG